MKGRWTPKYLQVLKRAAGVPFNARHTELSVISCVDEETPVNQELLTLALGAVTQANTTNLSDVSKRGREIYPQIWPGEHYRLLAGIVKTRQPKTVVEIGTYTGMGTLALAKFLPPGGQVYTFDVASWKAYPKTAFRENDFKSGKIVHIIDDLCDPRVAKKHRALLRKADVIFIDAVKDGVMEYTLWAMLKTASIKDGTIIIFDDIKVWNMLHFWRMIDMPKLDVTSFGHWSGTGLILWNTKKWTPLN